MFALFQVDRLDVLGQNLWNESPKHDQGARIIADFTLLNLEVDVRATEISKDIILVTKVYFGSNIL